MKALRPTYYTLVTVLTLILSGQIATAKTMYRWVDENGKVSFSDQVPPTKADLKHEQLDKNAKVVKVTEKAKTKAELELEKRLELLKKQKEKIILEQQAHDKKLLSSFIDLSTMDASHKTKTMAFKSQEHELSSKLKELEDGLAGQQQEAAGYEIKNQKVPGELLEKIALSQKEIVKTKQDIKDLTIKKADYEKEFKVDRARFEILTKAKASANAAVVAPDASIVEKAVNDLGLFSCEQVVQCEKAWSIAREFVQTNSSTKINTDTDRLVMTDDPAKSSDMSLSISKINSDDKSVQIFLDIRCQDSTAGKALCEGSKAQGFRVQFSQTIKNALNAPAPAVPPATTPAAPATTPVAPGVTPAATPAKK